MSQAEDLRSQKRLIEGGWRTVPSNGKKSKHKVLRLELWKQGIDKDGEVPGDGIELELHSG